MEGRTGPLMDSWLFVCVSLGGERPLLLLLRMSGRLQFNGHIISVHAWAHAFGAAGVWRSLLSMLVWLDTQLRPSFTVLASTGPDGGLWLLMVHLSGCLVLFLSLSLSVNRSDSSVTGLALPLTSSFIGAECRVHFSLLPLSQPLHLNHSPEREGQQSRGEERRRKDSFTS